MREGRASCTKTCKSRIQAEYNKEVCSIRVSSRLLGNLITIQRATRQPTFALRIICGRSSEDGGGCGCGCGYGGVLSS